MLWTENSGRTNFIFIIIKTFCGPVRSECSSCRVYVVEVFLHSIGELFRRMEGSRRVDVLNLGVRKYFTNIVCYCNFDVFAMI